MDFAEDLDQTTWENFSKNYHPKRLFPIIVWGRRYKLDYILRDCIAGFTIGLMLLPQSLAYAELAGLDVYYGLYSAFLGVAVYTIFGTAKEIVINFFMI